MSSSHTGLSIGIIVQVLFRQDLVKMSWTSTLLCLAGVFVLWLLQSFYLFFRDVLWDLGI